MSRATKLEVIRNAVAAAPANVKLLNEESALAGHELCTQDPWFNNVDIWLFVTDYSKSKWPLHPNQKGQQKIATDLAASYGS